MARSKSLKNSTGRNVKPVPVKIVSESPSKSYVDEDKKWRAQDDLRALQRAEEIRKDKERMKAAKECAKEQMNNLKDIC